MLDLGAVASSSRCVGNYFEESSRRPAIDARTVD